ncbi:MAG: hypothetical protein PF495_05805 [Spirochaetales bacterium]|jgi:hypothetical protein|nr:hypothetical protein [Spirochaetales bacterium]
MGTEKKEVRTKKSPTKRQKLHLLVTILQVLIGVYLIAGGVEVLTGGWRDLLEGAVAALQLSSGSLLIASLFALDKTKVLRRSVGAVVILWAAAVLLMDVAGQPFFSPGFNWLVWIQTTGVHIIILVMLLIVRLEKL